MIVTITTDFGESIYLSILKAVILNYSKSVRIENISNNIDKFNIKQASFFVENSYFYFPEETIHLCVVDPGVGSNRKGIIIKTDKYFFVGPDNGVFSFLKKDEIVDCYEITYKPEKISFTFHGRDIFAPVVGKILRRESFKNFARNISWKDTFTSKYTGRTKREVIYIDDFGNIFLDLKYTEFKQLVKNKPFKLIFKNKVFEKLNRFYYEVGKNEVLLLVNSLGYLEIAVREGNAKNVLNAKVGDKYEIKID